MSLLTKLSRFLMQKVQERVWTLTISFVPSEKPLNNTMLQYWVKRKRCISLTDFGYVQTLLSCHLLRLISHTLPILKMKQLSLMTHHPKVFHCQFIYLWAVKNSYCEIKQTYFFLSWCVHCWKAKIFLEYFLILYTYYLLLSGVNWVV